jgi:hypothetical protein
MAIELSPPMTWYLYHLERWQHSSSECITKNICVSRGLCLVAVIGAVWVVGVACVW